MPLVNPTQRIILIFCLLLFTVFSFPNPVCAVSSGLKIMTLNLHDGQDEQGRENLAQTVKLFQTEAPDVIALQEVEPGQLAIFKDAGYQVITGMNHNLFSYHFGNAVLTRHRIIYHRHHYLPSTLEQRGVDEVAIEVRGKVFILLNTHLGLGQREQQRQLDEILRIIHYLRGPIILCGDFNVTPSDQIFSNFNKDFQEIGTVIPLTSSFPASSPKERLDQFWYSRDWLPLQAQTLAWNGSDHLPVIGEFQINEPSSTLFSQTEIPEPVQENNPLLPNIGSPGMMAITVSSDKADSNWNFLTESPLNKKIRFSGEFDNSTQTATALLNYQLATFDLQDYLSKWRIRGEGGWRTSLGVNTDNELKIAWEQYYRWSDHGGTKIIVSDKSQKISVTIEQQVLLSSQLGCSLRIDSNGKPAIGIGFTPDQKNMVEIRWFPENETKWQISWKYQP